MRRFVREGWQLRERRNGIFGGMDVRMESMLFHSFCGIPLNNPLKRQLFFFSFSFLFSFLIFDIPFLYLRMPLHAYGGVEELMAKPNYCY